ncbi:MAG TPA: twin-arginine translocase TatA/TatE family subunit [Actinomycetales bacterium]|nr:twin-arginine translocase TatA/TatE family subunit [Actinomycetales bacterium]
MIAGINGSEALILLVIVLIVVGPERLPRYAAQLGKFVRGMKVMLGDAQKRVRDEMGAEGEQIPWDKLDPRQYDPRRIVRDAVMGEESGTAGAVAAAAPRVERKPGTPPPFDSEAT